MARLLKKLAIFGGIVTATPIILHHVMIRTDKNGYHFNNHKLRLFRAEYVLTNKHVPSSQVLFHMFKHRMNWINYYTCFSETNEYGSRTHCSYCKECRKLQSSDVLHQLKNNEGMRVAFWNSDANRTMWFKFTGRIEVCNMYKLYLSGKTTIYVDKTIN